MHHDVDSSSRRVYKNVMMLSRVTVDFFIFIKFKNPRIILAVAFSTQTDSRESSMPHAHIVYRCHSSIGDGMMMMEFIFFQSRNP